MNHCIRKKRVLTPDNADPKKRRQTEEFHELLGMRATLSAFPTLPSATSDHDYCHLSIADDDEDDDVDSSDDDAHISFESPSATEEEAEGLVDMALLKATRNVSEGVTPVPMAPLRRSGRHEWLQALLENRTDVLLAALEEHDEIDSEVFVEWVHWCPEKWTVAASEQAWVSPILLAARWSTPKTVDVLIKAGIRPHHRNHLGQNALVALCSQPPASAAYAAALRGHYAPQWTQYLSIRPPNISWLGNSAFVDPYEVGLSISPLEQQAAVLAKHRNEEMGLVAKVLLLAGVDMASPDWSGRNAIEYARVFGHRSVIKGLMEVASDSALYSSLSMQIYDRVRGARQVEKREEDVVAEPEPSTPRRVDVHSTRYETPPPRCTAFKTPRCSASAGMEESALRMMSCESSMSTGFGVATTKMVAKRRGRRLRNKLSEVSVEALEEMTLV